MPEQKRPDTKPELKACPCCGGSANLTENVTGASIFCPCGMTVTSHEWSGTDRVGKLAAIWNRRTPVPPSTVPCPECKYGIPGMGLCYAGGWEKCGGKLFLRVGTP